MASEEHVLAMQIKSGINPQASSPLFNRIPPEIRHEIFCWVLISSDYGTPYRKGTYHDRPGYHYPHRTDKSLLRTCRRIYLETYLLPVTLNEVVMFCGQRNRAPPDAFKYFRDRKVPYWAPIRTVEQRAFSRIHLFIQQFWLESRLSHLTYQRDFDPSILHITIRHTDWWWWELEHPLCMDPKQPDKADGPPSRKVTDPFAKHSWGTAFKYLHNLKEFVLELETVENKRLELDEIVSRAPTWQFPLADDRYLLLDPRKTRYSAWRGLNRFDNVYNQIDPPPISPYQTPRLKPKVVGMIEDILDGKMGPVSALIHCIPPLDGLEAEAPIEPNEKIRAYLGQQHTPTDYAQFLGHFRRTTWCCYTGASFSEVETGALKVDGPQFEHIVEEMQEELEELSALQYYVVELTWKARQPETGTQDARISSAALIERQHWVVAGEDLEVSTQDTNQSRLSRYWGKWFSR